jgi:putative transposase
MCEKYRTLSRERDRGCPGLLEALGEVYPDSKWQRCVVHFYRNVFTAVPKGKTRLVAAMLKAVHGSEDLMSARKKAAEVVGKLKEMKLGKAAEIVERGAEETFSYSVFPMEHWRLLRINNPLERINREIRRRTRVVGNFPDGQSALMLVAARLRHIASTKWGARAYMDMGHLYAMEREKEEKPLDLPMSV